MSTGIILNSLSGFAANRAGSPACRPARLGGALTLQQQDASSLGGRVRYLRWLDCARIQAIASQEIVR